MQWVIISVFIPGAFWVFGYPIMIPLGIGTYSFLILVSIIDLLDVFLLGKSLNDWLLFSVRRPIVGFILLFWASFFAWIPGMGSIVSVLLCYVALMDYYDYINFMMPYVDNMFNLPISRRGFRPHKEFYEPDDERIQKKSIIDFE